MKTRIDKHDVETSFIDAIYDSNDETFANNNNVYCDVIDVLRDNEREHYAYDYETNENETMFVVIEMQSQNEYIVAYDAKLHQITYLKQHSKRDEHLQN